MSFKTQVEDIVGVSITDTSAIADFLTASVREVADMLPMRALMLNSTVDDFSGEGAGQNASLTINYTGGDNVKTVSSVSVQAGGNGYTSDPTILISSTNGIDAVVRGFSDGSALIAVDLVSSGSGYVGDESAVITPETTNYDVSNKKVFNVSRNDRISVEVPFGLSGQIAVNSGSIHESTVRTPFHYYQGKFLYIHPTPTSSEKGQIFCFTYPTFANTAGNSLDIEDSDIPSFPNNAEFAVVLGGACKYFMKMISNTRELVPDLLNIDNLTISTTAPSPPTLVDNSVTFNANVPSYTPPELTVDITQFETFLETDEDAELAQVQLGRINTELQEYQSKVQNSLNEFNESNVIYQASLQVAIQNAQLSSKDDTEQLNKYAQETGAFSAEVNKEVQEYQANLAQKIQEANFNLSNITSEISILNNQYTMCEQKYQNEILRLSGKIGSDKK